MAVGTQPLSRVRLYGTSVEVVPRIGERYGFAGNEQECRGGARPDLIDATQDVAIPPPEFGIGMHAEAYFVGHHDGRRITSCCDQRGLFCERGDRRVGVIFPLRAPPMSRVRAIVQ